MMLVKPFFIAACVIAQPPANRSTNVSPLGIKANILSASRDLLPLYGNPYFLGIVRMVVRQRLGQLGVQRLVVGAYLRLRMGQQAALLVVVVVEQ